MTEWGGSKEDFEEEVELNELSRARTAIHDCMEAECDTDPNENAFVLPNGDPNPAAKPGIRPSPSARETALRNKHIRPRR